jgi:membrane protein YdbS with pleckstrin-like domain
MSWRDDFWSLVYDSRSYFRILLATLTFMLLLTAVSFLLGQPGTASYVLAYVNLILIVGCGVITTAMYRYAVWRQTNS